MVALKTFENLNEERKLEIIQASLEEFAMNEYGTASLSNIIKKLGLAKGSFYRYFENKQSLFFYVLDHCINLRIENDKNYITEEPEDFFDLMLLHIQSKIRFDQTQPLASIFFYNVLQERNSEELGNIRYISKQKGLDILEMTVDEFIKKGQLRTDMDAKLIAWSVFESVMSFMNYIEHRFQQDFGKNSKTLGKLYDMPEHELMDIAQQFVEIQKHGVSN
ncbi:MAG: TetR/AcrR family transcriptional regulator [Cyclobacteriaceae bacterium]|nr:TetR/AcrR family transcriptional regulator [Cyclobacteriaceae bacterium]